MASCAELSWPSGVERLNESLVNLCFVCVGV